jgi:MFS family permease
MFLSDYKWKAFLAVALSLFTMVMSMNITILALPVIARDFAVTLREVSWIVIAFSLTVTALLLPMGRLSDLIGRKKTLVSGIGLFIVGSLVCYLAESLFMLILGRVVMGIGASMGQGVGTAIVVSVFPQHERGKAIGSHTTVVAIGSAGGPVMAGVLLQFFPWQVIFLAVAVPAVLAFFLGLLILDDARIGSFQAEDTVFDWTGACLSALLMLFFVLTLNSPFPSENDFWILLIGIPGTLILLRTFIFWELKTGSPLLDL